MCVLDTGEGEIVFWPEFCLMGNVEYPWFDSRQEQDTFIFRISKVPTPFLVSIASNWLGTRGTFPRNSSARGVKLTPTSI